MTKHGIAMLFAAGFCAAGVGAGSAQAADMSSGACNVSGLVQGGGLFDRSSMGFVASPSEGAASWGSGFGEAALAYECGGWGAQVDGALHAFGTSGYDTYDHPETVVQGHLGGALFLRDANRGTIGLSASRTMGSLYRDFSTANNLQITSGIWRLGAFGELYSGDNFTFGAGGYFLTGNTGGGFSGSSYTEYKVTGFEGDIFAKYYASNSLAFSLRADVDTMTYSASGFIDSKVRGVAGTAEVEYLVPNMPASLFLGGRLARQDLDLAGSPWAMTTDAQGFVGVRFAFGGNAANSLRERDRHGTIDNTSVMQEKIVPMSTMPMALF